MADRVILHSDLNCFYASVEMMLNPSLRGKAVAVCGSTEDRHGIVLAKSELAKRAGIKTGMVAWEAKQKCPEVIFVPPQYEQYLKYSALTRSIYNRFTDQVEPYGMDECWLDVTGSRGIAGEGMTIAETIRRTVREELGLTVSIGVSFNKIFAKLGSDMKKPDAITQITREDFKDKVWPLPAADLLYVGRATNEKLAQHCVYTIGDIAAQDPENLKRWFGVNGLMLWRYAAGADNAPVMNKDFVSPVKSVGHGITCVADLANEEEVWKVMAREIVHIPARRDLSNRAAMTTRKIRVAAYCRVSTEQDEQLNSFENQVTYYTEFITNNPQYELAGIYADEGISGTSTRRREQFQQMIADCEAGKIDLIITKSISRFARNTQDCLNYSRHLKDLGIGIQFEKENISTLDSTGELLFTILSSLAQDESRSISENCQWGIRSLFKQGVLHLNANRFYGYDKDEKGHLIINKEQGPISRKA